jgi:hypothetical protein
LSPALLGLASKVKPVVRLKRGSIELVMDEKLERPLLKIGGKRGEEAYVILTKKFLRREDDDCSEVLIPLTALPAVSVWLLASYTGKPSEDLLDELLARTPRVVADLFWNLVELSQDTYEYKARRVKPLIDHRLARARGPTGTSSRGRSSTWSRSSRGRTYPRCRSSALSTSPSTSG